MLMWILLDGNYILMLGEIWKIAGNKLLLTFNLILKLKTKQTKKKG